MPGKRRPSRRREPIKASAALANAGPRLPIRLLRLDKENPRLAAGPGGNTQDALIGILWSEMDAEEIALSILANGFLPEEPLLVYKEKGREEYVVVEGNRRLAAVRVLREDSLRRKVGATQLPRLTNKQFHDLDALPVSIYPDRKSLWKYTGFRHINGPKQWDSFSKGMYVAHVHESYGVKLDDIARTIGDRYNFVRRIYRGYMVLQQAQARCNFDIEDRVRSKFAFSHLYTALSDTKFQRFLGLKDDDSIKSKPVPRSKMSNLCELMVWLYGRKSQNIEPVVRTQAKDLWRLQAVISDSRSLAALRAGKPFEYAFQISGGEAERFRESLTVAREELLRARGTVIRYEGEEDLFGMIIDCIELAEAIRKDMQAKRKSVQQAPHAQSTN